MLHDGDKIYCKKDYTPKGVFCGLTSFVQENKYKYKVSADCEYKIYCIREQTKFIIVDILIQSNPNPSIGDVFMRAFLFKDTDQEPYVEDWPDYNDIFYSDSELRKRKLKKLGT